MRKHKPLDASGRPDRDGSGSFEYPFTIQREYAPLCAAVKGRAHTLRRAPMAGIGQLHRSTRQNLSGGYGAASFAALAFATKFSTDGDGLLASILPSYLIVSFSIATSSEATDK